MTNMSMNRDRAMSLCPLLLLLSDWLSCRKRRCQIKSFDDMWNSSIPSFPINVYRKIYSSKWMGEKFDSTDHLHVSMNLEENLLLLLSLLLLQPDEFRSSEHIACRSSFITVCLCILSLLDLLLLLLSTSFFCRFVKCLCRAWLYIGYLCLFIPTYF